MLWSQFSAIFDNFRRKNWRFSQKPMLWSIFSKFSFVLSQKRQFFCKNFRRKYFKNHNIGPWSPCLRKKISRSGFRKPQKQSFIFARLSFRRDMKDSNLGEKMNYFSLKNVFQGTFLLGIR
jgi:hypothetical protein